MAYSGIQSDQGLSTAVHYFPSCINCTSTTPGHELQSCTEIRGLDPKQIPGTAISGSCLSEGLARAHLSDGLPTQMSRDTALCQPGPVSIVFGRPKLRHLWKLVVPL